MTVKAVPTPVLALVEESRITSDKLLFSISPIAVSVMGPKGKKPPERVGSNPTVIRASLIAEP